MAPRSRGSESRPREPGASRAAVVLGATAVGRAPITVFSVLFILQSQLELGRFDVGGFAVLAYSAGAAVNGVAAGWLISRLGQLPVVVATTAISTAALLLGGSAPGDPVLMLVLAAVIGLGFPPLHISSRVIYPRILSDAGLLRVYSVDVALIQISWIVAPVLVVAVAAMVGVGAVYAALAAVTAVGAVVYLLLTQRLAAPPTPVPWRTDVLGTLLRDGRMHVYVLVLGAFLASSGFLLPLLIALFPEPGQQSMTILVWSIGSTAGSLLVNRRGISRTRLTAILGIGVAALAVAALVPGLVTMNIALFLLGFATAPIAAAVFYFTSQHFRARHQAVIFGAITSVQLVSEGLGTSASGVMLDAGAVGGIWLAAFALLAGVLVLIARNARRAFTHDPVPRTGAIPVAPSG